MIMSASLLESMHCYSSKQAKKRAKKEAAAIPLMEDREDPEFHIDNSIEKKVNLQGESPKKRTRGPSIIDVIGESKRKRVEIKFKDLGQPIGKKSNGLSSFIGSLIKEVIPLTLNSWHQVDKDTKQRLWICAKLKFKLAEYNRRMILMFMGRICRNNKSVLSIKIRNLANSKNVKEHLEAFMDLKPIYIKDDEQWEAFVKMRTSAKLIF